MTMHTPGTWRVKPNSVGGPTVGPEGAVVADIRTYGGPHVGGQQHPQTVANARLIAAAPTMYEYIASSASNGCAEARKIMEAINAGR